MALPGETKAEDITDFYRGMNELAQTAGVAIIGGNITSAPLVTITITVIGNTGNDETLLTRAAAKPGEKIAVTGHPGAAAAGMEILTGRLKIGTSAASSLKAAFRRPQPRISEGQQLVKLGVKAAIDISDGLVSDLGHVCQASHAGALINVDLVPVHPTTKANFSDHYLDMALTGGEDYELLFTGSAEVINRVREAVACPITVIGEITAENAGEIALIDSEGKPFPLTNSGWEHFNTR
ncbi:thiamine-phosphate kinase [Chloroflexota bacterium]